MAASIALLAGNTTSAGLALMLAFVDGALAVGQRWTLREIR